MVRYINATVHILEKTTEENYEGDLICSYSEVETIKGDVQPASLSQDERMIYGLSTRKGLIRKFFYNGLHTNVKAGNRAKVESDLSGTTETFEIMPVNAWSRHGECLLVPVENEVEEGFVPLDNEAGNNTGDNAGTGDNGSVFQD